MNSTAVGDTLEAMIHALLLSEIENDRFWAKKSCCKVFRKKGYFSRDRQKNIVFDIAIEIYLPGAQEYSVLVVFECKNYSHPVPVDDVEEFFSKLQQVSGANVKGVVAATSAFQSGARTYSKSKGLGLLRYFDKSEFKWELKRSPSAGTFSTRAEDIDAVDRGLSDHDYSSGCFDLFAQSPVRLTNSLWDLFEDVAAEAGLDDLALAAIENSRNRVTSHVPFLERDYIEARSEEALADISYVEGEVPLAVLCGKERVRRKLEVRTLDPGEHTNGVHVLGRIIFDPLEIHLFRQQSTNHGRERFTLAHELGHHFLDHGCYMSGEFCEESDFLFRTNQSVLASDIRRMEWQANHFASAALMPRSNFARDARKLIRELDILDRGFGPIYVDNQACNLQNYGIVTSALMRKYGVSRCAATYRLEELGLLVDRRGDNGLRPIVD